MVSQIVDFHHDPVNGGFFTTRLFWDCECPDGYQYIHSVHTEKCEVCGTHQDDAPDARLNEVILHRAVWELDEQDVETALNQAALEPIPF